MFCNFVFDRRESCEKTMEKFKDCVSAIVKAKSRIVISVANPSSTSCTRSFSLSGLPTNQIGEGREKNRALHNQCLLYR